MKLLITALQKTHWDLFALTFELVVASKEDRIKIEEGN